MKIEAIDLGKRFQKEWIFRNFNYTFTSHNSYAIIGPNGSGKSTLLKVLTGMLPPSTGKISYDESRPLDEDEIFRNIMISAPYLELIEELTLKEFLNFHFRFKSMIPGKSTEDLMDFIFLKEAQNKSIKNFSSGMKQRLKLGICFFSDVPVLFLDEPTSNLDAQGIAWYHKFLPDIMKNRMVFICSNIESEYSMCDFKVDLKDLK